MLKTKKLSLLPILTMTASVVIIVSLFTMSGLIFETEQFADANIRKKIHFTQTVSSSLDPSVSGAGTHHIAFVLSPNLGTIYDGSITFASSVPTDVLILHAMTSDEIKEASDTTLPIWTVDDQTKYAASVISFEDNNNNNNNNAGAIDFTGAAIALYSTQEFVATASVDAWVRGEPTPVAMQSIAVDMPVADARLLLSHASVPAVIPMHKGMHDGESLLYIITDVNDADYASKLSEAQKWNVTHAPSLSSSLPEIALQQVYVFRNGVEGDGLYGYQSEVFSSTPANSTYSALSEIIEVSWKPGQNWIVLESVDEVIKTEKAGRIIFATNDQNSASSDDAIIANMHQIPWTSDDDDDAMDKNQDSALLRADTEFSDDMSYGTGQITNIDTENMTVTFVAHRSWGPDGQTIYHIITSATPQRPAGILGVEFTPVYASLVDHSSAADMYIFENGIIGSGSVGFQPAIFSVSPIDNPDSYTPMWRVHTVEWNDPKSDARILENIYDIESFRDADALTAGIARPTNSYYVINAPIIDPFQ